MTTTGPQTGLTWNIGADLVSTIPATQSARERQLARMVRIPCTSIQDRDTRFAERASNDRFVVDIPSLDERHEWDGTQWVIWDTKVKRLNAGGGFPIWYQSGGQALAIRSGALWIDTYRMGRVFKWSMYLKRGSDSDRGTASYSFWCPVPVANYAAEQSSGAVRPTGGTDVYGYSAIWINNQNFVLTQNNARLSNTSYSWAEGDVISASGIAYTGGYR